MPYGTKERRGWKAKVIARGGSVRQHISSGVTGRSPGRWVTIKGTKVFIERYSEGKGDDPLRHGSSRVHTFKSGAKMTLRDALAFHIDSKTPKTKILSPSNPDYWKQKNPPKTTADPISLDYYQNAISGKGKLRADFYKGAQPKPFAKGGVEDQSAQWATQRAAHAQLQAAKAPAHKGVGKPQPHERL